MWPPGRQLPMFDLDDDEDDRDRQWQGFPKEIKVRAYGRCSLRTFIGRIQQRELLHTPVEGEW